MPGAGKQPPEVQENIKELLEAGFDPTTIHRRLKVGRSSIYRMKRCLQQHGTAYMPTELNKKNGRPKVLTAEQELEVRDWLRKPENRTRYLDDLVWLIHDRFGIVCSTTTMSKMKRKWLRVIEYEETGRPLDATTRDSLLETHPDLPVLHDPAAVASEQDTMLDEQQQQHDFQQPQYQDGQQQQHPYHNGQMGGAPPAMMMAAPETYPQAHAGVQQDLQQHVPIEPQIDSQLEQQIQREIATAEPQRV